MNYRREIDGLRALAVLPVVLFHAGVSTFRGGYVGVDIFFVISGYLITALIVRDLTDGTFSLRDFYERRLRRIAPALVVVMACCLPPALMLMLPGELQGFSRSVISVVLLVSNILFWTESGYFRDASEEKPLLHTWSLAVEEQYYLLVPLLLLFAWRWGGRRVALLIGVAAAVSLGLAELGSRTFPIANFFIAPTRAWELFAGGLCALYHAKRAPHPNSLLAAAGLLLLAGSMFYFSEATRFPSLIALLPVGGTVLLLLFSAGTPVARFLCLQPLVWIGLVSYSAYLWHQPILAFLRLYRVPITGWTACVVIGAVFALAYLTWRFVERPFRNRTRTTTAHVVAFVLALVAVNVGVAAAALSRQGFIERFAPEDRELASLGARDSGAYVARRFERLKVAHFDAGSRTKVLVIGDSFAQDLVNAVHEAEFAVDSMSIVTLHIPPGCGNLFLKWDHSHLIASESLRARCASVRDYGTAEVQELLHEADYVWLASNWSAWEIPLIPESLRNIATESVDAQVLVFGSKHFGKIDVRRFLDVPAPARPALRNSVPLGFLANNDRLRASIPAGQFVDVQAMMCGRRAPDCRVFDEHGGILTSDGRHLTRTGARHLGERLRLVKALSATNATGAAVHHRGRPENQVG